MYKQDPGRGIEKFVEHRAQQRGDIYCGACWQRAFTYIKCVVRFLASFDVRNSSIERKLAYTVRYTLGRPHTIHCTPSTFDMRRTFSQLYILAMYILHFLTLRLTRKRLEQIRTNFIKFHQAVPWKINRFSGASLECVE